tara:strand:- start:156 stop:413 length:258 start_codon:yes stop_codon:yes gene_type:complete
MYKVELRKFGYELIQYMASGNPVIASPIGVNSDMGNHGVNGFLVKTEAGWIQAFDPLLVDLELEAYGHDGRGKSRTGIFIADLWA